MKVLVTGAAGFIGGQLMHALWKNGHTAIGVDNYSYGSADNPAILTTMIFPLMSSRWISAIKRA